MISLHNNTINKWPIIDALHQNHGWLVYVPWSKHGMWIVVIPRSETRLWYIPPFSPVGWVSPCMAESHPTSNESSSYILKQRKKTAQDLLPSPWESSYMGVSTNGGTPKIDGLCHGKSHLQLDENWVYPS